jgi:hypothetical protein
MAEKISLKEHFDELRAADQRALSIADTARAEAIALARDIQTYKDSQHNDILRQWSESRATYATKEEMASLWEKFQTAHQPVLDFINNQRGKGQGIGSVWIWALGAIGCMTGLAAIFLSAIGLVLFALHASNPTLP